MDLITPTKVIGNGKHILVNSDNLLFFEKFKEEIRSMLKIGGKIYL